MKFLVLKPDYPHAAASNSLFSVKKGEIFECPVNYKPSTSFLVFESQEAALKYIHKDNAEFSPPVQEEQKGKSLVPSYPLFRRVAMPDGEPVYQLFARDIHRFLSRHEEEVVQDIRMINVHPNTAQRLLDYERKHFSREAVMNVLDAIVKGELPREEKGKPEEEVVEEVEEKANKKEAAKGITTTNSMFGKLSP